MQKITEIHKNLLKLNDGLRLLVCVAENTHQFSLLNDLCLLSTHSSPQPHHTLWSIDVQIGMIKIAFGLLELSLANSGTLLFLL